MGEFVCFWDSIWNSVGRSPKFTLGTVVGSPQQFSPRQDLGTCSKSPKKLLHMNSGGAALFSRQEAKFICGYPLARLYRKPRFSSTSVFSSLECLVPDAPLLQLLRRESYIDWLPWNGKLRRSTADQSTRVPAGLRVRSGLGSLI